MDELSEKLIVIAHIVRQAPQERLTNAEAIREAVQRPSMRLVLARTKRQQGILVIHQVREVPSPGRPS